MLIDRKSAKKISRMVEKRLRKSYQSNAYFYIDKIEMQLEDCVGFDTLYCRAGYEIYVDGQSTGKYRTINFKFSMTEAVKNIKEYVAVLVVHTIDSLDDFDSFEDKGE